MVSDRLVMDDRFQIGASVTYHEARTAFSEIFRRPMPRGSDVEQIVRNLSTAVPLRFEFEVNRVRGFAWNMEELN